MRTITLVTLFTTLLYSSAFSQNNLQDEFIIDDYCGNVFDIHSGDIDGDGIKDLLTMHFSYIQSYKGIGNNQFGVPLKLIDIGYSSTTKMFLNDFDGDGHLDILCQLGNDLRLYPNDGDGNFSDFSLVLSMSDCVFYLEDIYGDGDLDVIVEKLEYFWGWEYYDYDLYFYENNGDGSLAGSQLILSSNEYTSSHLNFNDADGDGDMDFTIVVTNYSSWQKEYHLAINTGSSFDIYLLEDYPGYSSGTAIPVDFNGDGHIDVLAHDSEGNTIVIENDGNSNFNESYLISDQFYKNIQVFDVDNDEDCDIVYCSGDTCYWDVNDGNGNFDTSIVILEDVLQTYPLNPDDDLDLDLFGNYRNKTVWFENEANLPPFTFDFDLCDNDSIYFAEEWIHTGGIYYDSLLSINGQDSIIVYNITSLPSPPEFAVSGATEVALNSIETYSVPENIEVEYTWQVEYGNIIDHPSDNSITVQWSNTNIVGEIEVVSEFIETNACSYNTTITITVGDNGVNEINNSNISVYPNPADEWIFINSDKALTCTIYNLQMKQLLQTKESEINISHFTNGVYLISLQDKTNKTVYQSKLVKRSW